MMQFRTLVSLLAGIVMILGTNFVVISGAKWNRSGEPESMLELTERELRLRNLRRRENSGASFILNINYGIQTGESGYLGRRSSNWLSRDKLREIGIDFDISEDRETLRRRLRKQLPVSVYLVVEYDGEAYRSDVLAAQDRLFEAEALLEVNSENAELRLRHENLQKQLNYKKEHASRLYIIDTGLDPEDLRRNYPDRNKYMIISGRIRVYYQGNDDPQVYAGIISGIDINKIHVPLEHREVLDNLPAPDTNYEYSTGYPPRYKVTLAYGKRHEPWVMNVSGL